MPTALVTGGAGGIGGALCRRLAGDGYRVVLHYHSGGEAAASILTDLKKISGRNHTAIAADLTDRAQAEALFCEAGPVDALVNNAGIAQQKLFTDVTEEDWRHMFAVNVDAVFRCCQLALPCMIRQKSGAIVNISSMWGQVGASCEVSYSAAKAAVIGLTRALAKEVGLSGVRVNCIAPGVIDTPMNAALSAGTLEGLREETPLACIGTPEDVAEAAAFLLSDRARFITGQTLGVNGGFVI